MAYDQIDVLETLFELRYMPARQKRILDIEEERVRFLVEPKHDEISDTMA